jgi:hypothetical protein
MHSVANWGNLGLGQFGTGTILIRRLEPQRRNGNLAEDFHSRLLRIKKTTSHFFAKSMRTLDVRALQLDRFDQCRLHCKLSGFAFLIRGSAKISIRFQIDDLFGTL